MACRLSPLQRQLYVDILARNFEALNGRAKGSAKNSLNNVLMNLRKACDHPFLFEVRSMMREQQMQPGLATCSAPLGTCLASAATGGLTMRPEQQGSQVKMGG